MKLYKADVLRNNNLSMSSLKRNQDGFIPLLLTVLGIVVALIIVIYLRVSHASK